VRSQILAFILLVAVDVVAQDRVEYRMVNAPGALESTLALNGHSVIRHQLGSLTPPGTVTVSALLAVNEAKQGVKGLEVQLEGDDIWNNNRHCKDTVYIDEDALVDFEREIANLVDSEKYWPASDSDQSRSGVPTIALPGNTANGKPKNGVFYVPVEFGSYWGDGRYGVYVMAPHSEEPAGSHPGCQFRMPNADISELLTLVRDGRQWLSHQPSTVQLSEAAADSKR